MTEHMTDWMHDARWGTMTHYLAAGFASDNDPMTPERWNRIVDDFDAERFAQTIADTGSGYHIFTRGQNSGFSCSPNETYDRIVGRSPEESWLSRRDLIMDVADALLERGVKPMVYCTSTLDNDDHEGMRAFKCTPPWEPKEWSGWKRALDQIEPVPGVDERMTEFQQKWEAVHREWSHRWGDRIYGWWIDGCYYADKMYRHDDAPNFASFAAALKAGNPDSLVAFNPGVNQVGGFTEQEDYTAGEVNDLLVYGPTLDASRFVDGAQLHILSFLGGFWGWNEPTLRFRDELAIAYTHHINDLGGAITWDIPLEADGTIPTEFVRQLTAIGNAL